MRIFFLLICILEIVSVANATSKKEEIHLVTFEAPPYLGEKLPEHGAGIYALREIIKKTNFTLKVTFVPPLRAKQIVNKDGYAGFFPVSLANLPSGFKMSRVFYRTPWMIAERKSSPILWEKTVDLIPYKIGNVAGYDLYKDQQELVNKKKLHVESASNDEANLLKLANKRVDLIFIEAAMFEFLMKTSPRLKPFQKDLQLNPRIVNLDEYGIAFKDNKQAQEQMAAFNKAITEEHFTRLISEYFKKHPALNP
ncbi:substrate-binding periplasmic protein [Bdellovibrio bacteriovorus]|uniref:substrate-binding periplasmic protein n=1 Tax=Bdellovibrio bacteriovorus TaxID=959 RepID=UPI0035A5F007